MRVLFFSGITVTPTTGGGNFVYNLLEPPPEDGEVFYVGPQSGYPGHMAPFPELMPRMRTFPNEGVLLLPALREGMLRKGLRGLKSLFGLHKLAARLNSENARSVATERILEHVRELRPDVLLACPQPLTDVIVATDVAEAAGLPTVVWFMDDYYDDRVAMNHVSRLWNNSLGRFVSSDTMREKFSTIYGGDCGVLLNPIRSPEAYSPPVVGSDGHLRIAYAGTVNSYYMSAMREALEVLRGLGDRVTLDVYTADELPVDGLGDEVPVRRLPLVSPERLVGRLREYDVLLLLSSFEPEWRTVAETAQAGKLADYLAAGRCILAYGPDYADNVRYLRRHGIGEVVTSQEPDALRGALLSLAESPERRREIGERAYHFGREYRDKAKTRDRLWRALSQTASYRKPPMGEG